MKLKANQILTISHNDVGTLDLVSQYILVENTYNFVQRIESTTTLEYVFDVECL